MNNNIIDSAYKRKTNYTPVWYMRQAGRYLPEYRKLKERYDILTICKTPELASKVSLMPVDTLGVDAAILFADIMIPLIGVGLDIQIVDGIGPVVRNPVKTTIDVETIRMLEPGKDIPYLLQTIKILTGELEKRVPLIGFSAAPFTLASYLIEGKPTRNFLKTKSIMYSSPRTWKLLMNVLSDIIIIYLKAQMQAGVQLIQLFDSWVGCLSDQDYVEYVLPYTSFVCKSVYRNDIPLIHFGTDTAALLTAFASVPCDVISVDWRVSLEKAWEAIKYKKAMQGNLDPALMLCDFSIIKKRVDELFDSLSRREGYIFNLGHGVLPDTPVENMQKLTEYVHGKSYEK